MHGTAVKFFGYGNRLDGGDATEIFIQALQDCDTHLPHDEYARMGMEVKTYSSGGVRLTLAPGRQMTWNTYHQALLLIVLFAHDYGCLRMGFEVWSRGFGVGSVGTGTMARFHE